MDQNVISQDNSYIYTDCIINSFIHFFFSPSTHLSSTCGFAEFLKYSYVPDTLQNVEDLLMSHIGRVLFPPGASSQAGRDESMRHNVVM